jgi:DNA repair photolyase
MNSQQEYFAAVNSEPLVQIKGKTTGRELSLREYTYGALVPDHNHPLSSVSVSNSSLSIDLWVGCAWQCRYCHVQGTSQDLAEQGTMPKKPRRRNEFTVDQILDELIKHPFFVADETIISIGTASTEPFAPGPVTDSTFEIMNAFVRRGLKNPFWIVTKGGIPKGRKLDFARISNATRGLMLSLCWADNPNSIEPAHNNRFLNVEEAKEAGATIAWYMRPIVPEWSGNHERIEMMMLWVKKHYGHLIDMIVPGGLRWTEGIENGLVEIHKLPMPDISQDDNVKSLPQDLMDSIFSLSAEHFPGIPVYLKSSCALTQMLKVPSITSVQAFARQECETSRCPLGQRKLCSQGSAYSMTIEQAQHILDALGIPAHVVSWDTEQGLVTHPEMSKFTYAVRQTVFKHLAMGGSA